MSLYSETKGWGLCVRTICLSHLYVLLDSPCLRLIEATIRIITKVSASEAEVSRSIKRWLEVCQSERWKCQREVPTCVFLWILENCTMTGAEDVDHWHSLTFLIWFFYPPLLYLPLLFQMAIEPESNDFNCKTVLLRVRPTFPLVSYCPLSFLIKATEI